MDNRTDRQLAAIMFADIVSYSRMMGENEEETLKILAEFEKISIPIVEKFKGVLIKKNGDQIFCEFSSSKNAVDASLEIQNQLSTYNDSRPKDFKLEIRIGIHIGDVVKREDGDIHGDGVNVAARIQPLASPGGICISGAVSEALSSHPKYNIISKGERDLKNILKKHSIFQLTTGHENEDITTNLKEKKISNGIKGFSLLTLIIIITSIWLFTSKLPEPSEDIRNYYIHLTSSDNYIENYYTDYGYGSIHYYEKDEYEVSSIPDSLLSEIRVSVFNKVSARYANQDVNIDVSFKKDEQNALNQLIYPKMSELIMTDEMKSHNQSSMTEFQTLTSGRYPYYTNSGLPDALLRFFIYKATNLSDNKQHYIVDRSATFKESFFTTTSSSQWAAISKKYDPNKEGVQDIIELLSDNVYNKIHTRTYGGNIVGKIIEELDHNMVKIKLNKPGSLKKKMKLHTSRLYTYLNGGAETRIEDFTQLIDFFKNNKDKKLSIWKHYRSDKPYDEAKAEEIFNDNIEFLEEQIAEIKYKLKNNELAISTNADDLRYYMEVVEVLDTIAIARVTGSIQIVYKIRIGDTVHISN